ncbi:MAG: response regulator [Verrucomicrobia bacterium]|nr:MAG: response regulator [Verrucomicrobiota bacterium]
MITKTLSVSAPDPRTGSLKEFLPGEPNGFVPVCGQTAGPPYFRVLVANNDELDRRRTISKLSEAWPLERALLVECVADVAEAIKKIRSNRLETIRSNRYALAVLDWHRPPQAGMAVLRALREGGLHIPVVVVSSQRRAAISHDLQMMGAGFVDKDKMDAVGFRNAIVVSILFQQWVFGFARSGHQLYLDALAKKRETVLVRGVDSSRESGRCGKRAEEFSERLCAVG